MKEMTPQRRCDVLADHHRMISQYAERTPDPKVREAGIYNISAAVVRNLRDAGYSPETITALRIGMAQITAIMLACPELKWS